MKLAIIDDDAAFRDTFTHFLNDSKIVKQNMVVPFASADELTASALTSFDAFFLDIYLGNDDGIALARKLEKMMPNSLIVFVTSSSERAVEAFSVDALHYLVKPLNQAKVDEALLRIKKEKDQRGKKLVLETKEGLLSVSLSELIYIESFGNDKFFKLQDRSFSLRRSTSEILSLLQNDPRFYLLSRSYIINLAYVKGTKGDAFELSTGECLPIPHERKKEVSEAFLSYLRS